MKSWLLLLLIGGSMQLLAAPSKPLSEAEIESVNTAAAAMQQAFEAGDGDAVIRHTHPAIEKIFGSQEQYETVIRQAIDTLLGNLAFEQVTWGAPSPLYAAGDEEVCILPRTTRVRFKGQLVEAESFVVAVRKAGTSQWLFLDGGVLRENPAKLWEMLPELPADVQLPPNTIKPVQ